MRLAAWLLLAGLALAPSALAQEDERGEDGREGEDDGEGGEALGAAALAALVAVGATATLNLARRRWLLPALKGRKEALARTMWLHRKVWLPVHLVTGLATLTLGILHGLAEEHGNWMLWTSMGAFGFLTVGGAILAWRWTPAKVRKGVYLLHTQQVLFIATLLLLWLGHALGDD